MKARPRDRTPYPSHCAPRQPFASQSSANIRKSSCVSFKLSTISCDRTIRDHESAPQGRSPHRHQNLASWVALLVGLPPVTAEPPFEVGFGDSFRRYVYLQTGQEGWAARLGSPNAFEQCPKRDGTLSSFG